MTDEKQPCRLLLIGPGFLGALILLLGTWLLGGLLAQAQGPTLTPCAYLPLIQRDYDPTAPTPTPTPIPWDGWQQGSGTDNIRFYCLAHDANETSSPIYAGGAHGVYGSIDGGRTWQTLGLTDKTVKALLYTDDVLYAGVAHGGVYRSIDGGLTWTARNTGLSSLEVTCLLVLVDYPDQPAHLYAGLYAAPGVEYSTDGGNTWWDRGAGLHAEPLILSLVVHPVTPTILYAGDAGGVYSTTTGGAVWAMLPDSPLDWIDDLTLDPADPQVVYAGQRGDWYGWPTGYRSPDGGITWADLPRGGVWAWGPDGLYCGTTEGAWYSDNEGASWSGFNENLGDLNVRDLAYYYGSVSGSGGASVHRFFAATDDGVWWRSTTATGRISRR